MAERATGFTPGPWDTHVARLSDGSINVAHVIAPTGYGVTQLCTYDEEQTVANARLIAAAPELFAACTDWIEYLAVETPGTAVAELRLLDAMRAAIAKARGHR